MEESQRGEGGTHVHGVQQDETKGPLHTLLSALSHEGWDPQYTAPQALKPLQEMITPLLAAQVPEGPLNDRGVHGHQVGPRAYIMIVFLHRCQVTPTDRQTVV